MYPIGTGRPQTIKKSDLTGEKTMFLCVCYKFYGVHVYVIVINSLLMRLQNIHVRWVYYQQSVFEFKGEKRKKVDSTSKSHFRAALLWIFIILISM